MRKSTRTDIYTYIKTHQPTRAVDIVKTLGRSEVRTHQILKYLVSNNYIYKTGSTPKVFYYATGGVEFEVKKNNDIYTYNIRNNGKLLTTIDKHISPGYIGGELLLSREIQTQIETYIEETYISQNLKIKPNHLFNIASKIIIQNSDSLYHDFHIYMKNNFEPYEKEEISDRFYGVYFTIAQHTINNNGRMDASIKLESLQPLYNECKEEIYLEHIYYAGVDKIDAHKTINYEKMELIKEFQDPELIDIYTSEVFGEEFEKFVQDNNFDTIVVVPNNVKRQISFNKHISTYIATHYDIHQIYIQTHVFAGRKPQKKISGICKRIENATKLFSVQITTSHIPKNMLIIDDVLGSGATINTIAKKLHDAYSGITCSGFALLGSYRTGFDVATGI